VFLCADESGLASPPPSQVQSQLQQSQLQAQLQSQLHGQLPGQVLDGELLDSRVAVLL
jgi:hypothetical protein